MEPKKIAGIHQPNYIPWLGYFVKIAQCNVFVFLDDAQFSNEGAHNYHYIKTPQGPLRLKVPVVQKLGDKILEVKTRDDLGWKAKHLRSIEMNYRKAPHFEQVFTDIKAIMERDYTDLSAMNQSFITFVCRALGIETEFVRSSDLKIDSVSEEKVIDICRRLDAGIYYSGTGAKAYQREENFLNREIALWYSEFRPLEYKQLWGDFVANVSIVDYLMHFGYSLEPIREKLDQEKARMQDKVMEKLAIVGEKE